MDSTLAVNILENLETIGEVHGLSVLTPNVSGSARVTNHLFVIFIIYLFHSEQLLYQYSCFLLQIFNFDLCSTNHGDLRVYLLL